MVARFDDICWSCFHEVKRGNQVIWKGPKQGIYHLACYLSKGEYKL